MQRIAEAAFVGGCRDFRAVLNGYFGRLFSKVNAPVTQQPNKGTRKGATQQPLKFWKAACLAAGCRCESSDAYARYQRRRSGCRNTPTV